VLFGASAGRTDARRRDAGDAGCIVEERQHSRYAPFTAAPLRVRPAGPLALCSLLTYRCGYARRPRLASGPGGQQQSVIPSETLVLLLEKVLESCPRIARCGGIPDCWAAASARLEVIAEICPVLVSNPLRLRLVAFVMRGTVVMTAIQAAMQVRVAFGTRVAATDARAEIIGFPALKTDQNIGHQGSPDQTSDLRGQTSDDSRVGANVVEV